nr:hypothetical protein [Mycoplasma phocoeninasale]
MDEQLIKTFNKKYKINTTLSSKFNFVADKDKLQTSSIAGKPKKLIVEILKRFFRNPVVLISLFVFITIILISLIIPASSSFVARDKITGSDYVRSLPPYYQPNVELVLDSTNDDIFRLYQNISEQAKVDPQYKQWLNFFLSSFKYELIDGTTSIKINYNAYSLVIAAHINQFINDARNAGTVLTDADIQAEFAKQTAIYSKVLLGTSSTGYDI